MLLSVFELVFSLGGKMIKINSKLENNIFGGIELKKGINKYKNSDYARMSHDRNFKRHILVKNIEVMDLSEPEAVKPQAKNEKEKIDYTKMSYNELVKFVKANNIKTKSMKTADILEALGGLN